jgi:cell division septal protein FtsQ
MESLNLPLKYRGPAGFGEPAQFQRGREKAPVKRIQRRVTVKFKHIFLFFFLLCASFYSLLKLYLFMITGDHFEVKRTQIVCRREFVRQDIQAVISASKLGNLLLLDISRLQECLEAHRWVKDARLRKIFPSSIKIEVLEREPAALLGIGGRFILIDQEGAHLESLVSREGIHLPLLIDSSQFREHYQQKLALAWECLASLTPGEAAGLEALDVSRTGSITVLFPDHPTRLVLGGDHFAENLRYYLSSRERLEGQAGPLEYVDLSIQDRVYLKPLPTMAKAFVSTPSQEVK